MFKNPPNTPCTPPASELLKPLQAETEKMDEALVFTKKMPLPSYGSKLPSRKKTEGNDPDCVFELDEELAEKKTQNKTRRFT